MIPKTTNRSAGRALLAGFLRCVLAVSSRGFLLLPPSDHRDSTPIRSLTKRWRCQVRMFTARAIQPEDDQGDQGLRAHGQLGPMAKRHDVGRAERGRVREAQVEVIEEQWAPAWRRDCRVQLLGERQGGVARGRWTRAAGPPPSICQ